MDFKKIYSNVKVAYGIMMTAIEFYRNHEEEIKPILSKAKVLGLSIKDGWDNYWKVEPIKGINDRLNLIENVNVDYDEVVDWALNKDVVSIEDVEKRFNLNKIESLLVLKQLESNNLVYLMLDKLGTYKVINE